MKTRHLIAALVAASTALGASAALAAAPGEQGFIDNCSACHQKTGAGIAGAFPSLRGNKFANGPAPLVAATLLHGRGGMPAFKDSLSDAQLSQIISYVRTSWGNKSAAIPPAIFSKARRGPPPSANARLQAH